MQLPIVISGVVAALTFGGAGYLLLDKPKTDLGGGSPTTIAGAGSGPRHDILAPVGAREATKRANATGEEAAEAARRNQTFVAQPVIAETQPTRRPEGDDEFTRRPAAYTSLPREQEPAPPPQRTQVADAAPAERVVERIIYVQAPPQAAVPTPNPQELQRINSQIEALLTPAQGGFVVQRYAQPERVGTISHPPVSRGAVGGTSGPAAIVVARAGDTVFALIDRAFNSDDPQAPIFATIHDVDAAGEPGPLHNVRMMGQVTYSRENAAILFTQAILQDGRQIPLRAIAVSERDARTGIARDVDHHTLERYGSLLVGGLVQGAGQVGQLLVAGSQNIVVNPLTGTVLASQNHAPYYQAGLGALLPAGQALTAAATQGFARPPTISAPAGMGIGIVFLDPVALPRPVANLR